MPVLVTLGVDDVCEALRRRSDKLNDVTCHVRKTMLVTGLKLPHEQVHAPLPSAKKGDMPSVR